MENRLALHLQHLFRSPSEVLVTNIQYSIMAMAEVTTLTLANIPLDVQISICLFLHPSDILALRKVCQHQKLLLLKSVKYYQDL